jgi:hypothetical protein
VGVKEGDVLWRRGELAKPPITTITRAIVPL